MNIDFENVAVAKVLGVSESAKTLSAYACAARAPDDALARRLCSESARGREGAYVWGEAPEGFGRPLDATGG